MKQKDEKSKSLPDKSSRIVPMTIMFVVLCGFSFYPGGIFCSEDRYTTAEVTKAAESSKETVSGSLQAKPVAFPECSADYHDYTPCTDPKRWIKYGRHRLTFMERHCPPIFEMKECLFPPPDGYKQPIRWPKSKNECWYMNVPYFHMTGSTSRSQISIG